MGWIDCLSRGAALGRGVLLRGRWAEASEASAKGGAPQPLRRPAAPFPLPDLVVSRPVVAAFNEFYYRMHPARMRPTVEHPESFFYPLDAIRDWNYLYGGRGFTQYQCVIPERAGGEGVRQFLALVVRKGGASMLSVIKDCGEEGTGLLSFPLRGTSIALDLPVRDGIQSLIDSLNELLIELGGRVYLAKDQFTRPEDYRRMEPRLDAWRAVKARVDPAGRLRSALSRRLELFRA
jgi:FAD/FMN-containing dehydrogenase